MVDNKAAAIKLEINQEYHSKKKHIKTRHFFIRELIMEGSIKVHKIGTELLLADMMPNHYLDQDYRFYVMI